MTRQKLIEDNMNLVYHYVSKYYPTYLQDEDIIQCGMVGLCKAADAWDETKSKFSTFAPKCIGNEIKYEFRKRAKHQGVLSLDYEVDGDDGERTTFGDFIVGDEDVEYIEIGIDVNSLTPREKQVYDLLPTGLSWKEIADIVGVSSGTVWKIIRKLKAMRG